MIRINGKLPWSSYFFFMLFNWLVFSIATFLLGTPSSADPTGPLFLSARHSIARATPQSPQSSLDTAAVRALYMDGEFEDAIKRIETARKNGGLKSHGDSVFSYKHLGVMYAANYETMEKGKKFMYQLLAIEPAVRIMDMYASDMIYMIFRNVQVEYELRHGRPIGEDTLGATHKDAGSWRASAKPGGSVRWPYWTAGAAALAGVGIAAFLLWEAGSPASDHHEGGL